ncbi:MAG: hypothetical protein WBW61_04405 [Rhodanobacteraceae bacterium]
MRNKPTATRVQGIGHARVTSLNNAFGSAAVRVVFTLSSVPATNRLLLLGRDGRVAGIAIAGDTPRSWLGVAIGTPASLAPIQAARLRQVLRFSTLVRGMRLMGGRSRGRNDATRGVRWTADKRSSGGGSWG